jgi:hypothetical protein
MNKNMMMKVAGMVLLGIGVAGSCLAVTTPEIDPSTGANAVALVAGALLVIRGRRR